MRGDALGPLHGVPFAVKDLVNTAGVRTTFGSVALADNVPAADSPAVARLKAAGAILVGKTTTPEFGHKCFTEAPLFGRTANPWDLSRTCGGSSGGAAAAVAAGLGPIGIGTDGGGSSRIPAACCGVVGFKQTLGLVPHDLTPDGFGNQSHITPMTRTVDGHRADAAGDGRAAPVRPARARPADARFRRRGTGRRRPEGRAHRVAAAVSATPCWRPRCAPPARPALAALDRTRRHGRAGRGRVRQHRADLADPDAILLERAVPPLCARNSATA